MKPGLVALFAFLPNILCEPTIEDNKVPTDEEVLKDLLIRQGQPEEEASLGLPTDEESFNELKNFLMSPASGTHHFVAASFPEIDARGFHESVFNGAGDSFSTWPKKRTLSDDMYPEHVTNEDLGIFHPFRDWSYFKQRGYEGSLPLKKEHSGLSRGKRQLPSLVQSCSLPGITCDPISQEGDDTPTSTPVPPTELPSQVPESVTNSTSASVENITVPSSTELILPISTRYLVKRSVTSTLGNKIGPENAPTGGDMGNKHHNIPTLHRLLKEKGLTFDDRTDRVIAVNLILSKLLAQMRARGHLKRLFQKTRPGLLSPGPRVNHFYGGFEESGLMKRKPEMSSSGFHGDTFNGGFGDFDIMKRKPEMSSSGFHGDTFNGGFGDFDIMKRKQEMSSSGFHGDTFNGGFGDFDIMKRKPEMSSSGFHGDTFDGGFGDFDIMKRKPEMSASGFHGDTFDGGFGDFNIMKREANPPDLKNAKDFQKGKNIRYSKNEHNYDSLHKNSDSIHLKPTFFSSLNGKKLTDQS